MERLKRRHLSRLLLLTVMLWGTCFWAIFGSNMAPWMQASMGCALVLNIAAWFLS